jgi:hypothetical protein
MTDLSSAMSPAAIVAKLKAQGIDVSERTLRQFARRAGVCRIVGKAMFFMPNDVDALLEAMKPPPSDTSRTYAKHTLHPASSDLAAARLKLRMLKEARKNR